MILSIVRPCVAITNPRGSLSTPCYSTDTVSVGPRMPVSTGPECSYAKCKTYFRVVWYAMHSNRRRRRYAGHIQSYVLCVLVTEAFAVWTSDGFSCTSSQLG